MAEEKKSFILYCDYIHLFEILSDEEAGRLIKHLMLYVNDKNPETSDRLLRIAFEPIKRQLKRDLISWNEFRMKQSEYGKLGGRPKKSNVQDVESQEVKKGSLFKKRVESLTAIVTDTVTDTVKRGVFTPPTQEEVCNEMQKKMDDCTSLVEAEKFHDFYSSKGWVVGKAKMKDWKSAVRNWIRSMNDFNKQKNVKQGTSEARNQAVSDF